MNSIDFLASQPENSLDMVYIDTDHTYNTTKLELEAAALAVKPSGLICGVCLVMAKWMSLSLLAA